MMSEDNKNDNRFMFGFFLGGLIGAVVLFLVGTKEGKKTGKLLEEKSRRFFDALKDTAQDVQEQSREMLSETIISTDHLLETVSEKKEDLSEHVANKLDSALAHIEAIQERGRENTTVLRKRLFKNIPKR